MKKVSLILPNQLFESTVCIPKTNKILIVEEYLFFKQFNFHKQKLVFHRATMKCYENYLKSQGYSVEYIESHNKLADVSVLIPWLIDQGLEQLHIYDPVDNWLEKRIHQFDEVLTIISYDNSLFLNSKSELEPFFKASKKKFYQTSFYKAERIKRNILMDKSGPLGGKWTYDIDNRKKYPKSKVVPAITFPKVSRDYESAIEYVNTDYGSNIGDLHPSPIYPTSFNDARAWLKQFFKTRFNEFGIYEDAIVKDQHFLNHSVLSPLINVGLLTPNEVLTEALKYAKNHDIPLNSLEGFIRQIMGWREFIRGVYDTKGSEERIKNFWGHSKTIPHSFYTGTTGILPVDITIKKILKTGYAHHIERLMILGNFMLLCEFDPDAVYQWFMELFIDAYDWVMVPNVYGMSLFADGGIMSTKPYISSSNYIKKMSDYPNGEWQAIWDGLFWRFMNKHREFLSKNPRLKMLINTLDKMSADKKNTHFTIAEKFLASLDNKKNVQLNLLVY